MLHNFLMMELIVLFRLLAVSQILFTGFAFLISSNLQRIRLAGVLLCIGVSAYLVAPLSAGITYFVLALLLGVLANLIPLFLYVFAWSVFEDDERMSRVGVIGGVVFVALVIAAVMMQAVSGFASANALTVIAQITKLLFVAAALHLAWSGVVADLIESRIRLRRYFLLATGFWITAVILVELALGWAVPAPIEVIGMALIFATSLAVNLLFLKNNPTFSFLPARTASREVTVPDALQDLQAKIVRDRIYANHDLRIRDLAERFATPEHQLRKLINRDLGYRNFNQFINRFRLEEAVKRLVTEPRLPILTISIDAGFRSISSFNTAFRAMYKQTPSDYRKARLTDSQSSVDF